ncbi:MAG: hypothetical protein ACI9RM_002550, partial [Ulvibacter sp.]
YGWSGKKEFGLLFYSGRTSQIIVIYTTFSLGT